MKGYEALRERAAWLDVSGRGKIRVYGEDRARLLHAMSTNDVKTLKPGEGCYSLFLSAQGRVLADSHILALEDYILIDTEPETREKMMKHLDAFIIADDVTLEDATDATATLALCGPQAAAMLSGAGAPVPEAEYGLAPWNGGLIVKASLTGGPGFLVIVPVETKSGVIAKFEAQGGQETTAEAFNIVRLENGKPRYGDDITERYLTQETNQLHAVSFNKGCYLGQEIVERVRSRAQIHRRLLPLRIDSSVPPVAGFKLEAEGKPAAEITSAAYSPALGATVALAYVRIEFKPGDVLLAGDAAATVLPAPPVPPAVPEVAR